MARELSRRKFLVLGGIGLAGTTAVQGSTSPTARFLCERMAELEWREHWLLYSASEGNVVAIDAHDPSRSVNLSAFARTLLGTQDDDSEGGLAIEASWAEG